MNAQIEQETSTYTEGALTRNEKVYTADCPDCGKKAKHTRVQLYTNGISHKCAHITIECPHCEYYEYIFLAKDI